MARPGKQTEHHGSGPQVLLTMLGNRDPFRDGEEFGPVLSLIEAKNFDTVYLFCSSPPYLERARGVQDTGSQLSPRTMFRTIGMDITSPIDYQEVVAAMRGAVAKVREREDGRNPDYSILLDPGTPTMQAGWFLLKYGGILDAKLLQGIPPYITGGAYMVREIEFDPTSLPELFPGSTSTRPAKQHPTQDAAFSDHEPHFIGEDPSFLSVIDTARRVAEYDVSVIITGETGTGKTSVARLIHEDSPRRDGPFQEANCASLPVSVVESTLFGHVKGAFTGATADRPGLIRSADGGTLFLDEIGDLPMEIQPKLLEVLERGTFFPVGSDSQVHVDVRLLCATHRDLPGMVETGKFRQDLFERLRQVTIDMPPLRDRRGDIGPLLNHFLKQWNDRYGTDKRFDEEAMKLLIEYEWRGNVRELANAVSSMCAISAGELLTSDILPGAVLTYHRKPRRLLETPADLPEEGLNLKALLFTIEKGYYEKALARTDGNMEQAAALLGINGPAFRKAVRERFNLR